MYYNGRWSEFGGTSLASPLWAAFTALADSSSACGGTPVGFANPALYNAAASDPSNFNDVTTGNNNIYQYDTNHTGLYPATTGYDMATGLGTPTASLATALCGGPGTPVVTVTSPGHQYSLSGTAVNLPVSASDSNNLPLTYTAIGLPPGLSIDATTGVISGTAPGIPNAYDVTVTATDSAGAQGTATFIYIIDGPDLSIGNVGAPNPVIKGKTLTYTITVTNTGGILTDSGIMPETGVTVTDTLPSSVKFISMSSGCTRTLQAGIPKAKGGTITCNNVAGLNSYNDTATITITVSPTVTGTLSDTARVSATGVQSDSDDAAAAAVTVKK